MYFLKIGNKDELEARPPLSHLTLVDLKHDWMTGDGDELGARPQYKHVN